MPRLQLLELPTIYRDEGPDETPFILVIDQASETTIEALGVGPKPDEPFNPMEGTKRALGLSVAEQIGARAILVFEETVDIPANDTGACLAQAEEQAEPDPVDERSIRVEAQLKAYIEKREAIEQDRKAALLDALDMDHARDWDDIRNAAAGLRKQRDDQAAELERLRTGEEPVTDERIAPTPGQWIWHFNRATPEKRLDMAAQILDNMPIARNCFMNDHEAQIERLRAEVERLRGEPERSPKE